MSYLARRSLVITALVVYCATGLLGETTPAHEIYPFFSWKLFISIPNMRQEYTIEIRSIGEKKYDPPLQFSQTKFLFNTIGQSPTQYTPIIQTLGYALRDGDAVLTAENRKKLERVFPSGSFSYDVLAVSYDPLVLWRTGVYSNKEILATFQGARTGI